MTNANDRGTFSCRIDGRAGYLRLYDDRIDLVRAGRLGPRVLGPESIPLHTITRVSSGKPGRLFTVIEVHAAGGRTELKLPSVDADSVRDLLASLVRQATSVAPVAPVAPVPSVAPVTEWTQREVAAAASVAASQIASAPLASPRPPLDALPSLPAAPAVPVTPEPGAPVPEVSAEIITAPAVLEAPGDAPRVVARPVPTAGSTLPAQPLPPDVEQRMDRLAVLHFAGILTDQEYEVRKAELLAEV